MKHYKIVFEYKDFPELKGHLIENNKKYFNLEQANQIVKTMNQDPKLSMFNHYLEAA